MIACLEKQGSAYLKFQSMKTKKRADAQDEILCVRSLLQYLNFSSYFFRMYLKFPIVEETGSIIAKVLSYFLRIVSNSTI